MSFYKKWGFSDEPFSHKPLEGNDIGSHLLVGRDVEKSKIKLRLRETDKICTVEGEIGIGKTSLINVAVYECFQEHEYENVLLIPCGYTFQLKEKLDINEFRKTVLIEVANTIIKYKNLLDSKSSIEKIEQYLKSERIGSISGGISILGCGLNGGGNKTLNSSKIFQDEIFYKLIEQALRDIRDNIKDGAIVCLIDNVELVNTHENLKTLVELMRDEVFNIPFTKWVLCGEQDIFMSVVESPRMSAYIHKPIKINKLQSNIADKMYRTRYDFYTGQYLPFTTSEFESLFRIFDGNTRDIFKCIDDYCLEVYENGDWPQLIEDKEECFGKWMEKTSVEYVKATNNVIEPGYFKLIYKLNKGKISNIDELKKIIKEEDIFKEWLFCVEEQHIIKVCEDGTIKYLRKGYILNYYFNTFNTYAELKRELKNRYKIVIEERNISDTEKMIVNA